ncbi:MAG: ankyrin repeat domain-containing protein [Candidatus Babeliales bacterium]|jgi:ankyrin repeat protein
MKKIFLYSTLYFFLLAGSLLYSSAPAQSSAIVKQDAIQFKGLTPDQEERFLSALSGDDTTIISTFDSKVVEENEYAFTKAAVVVHNKSFFDYFLNRLSPTKLQAKDDEQYSLLHVAAEVGNAHAVKNLIEKGLSVTDKTLTTGKSPLHAAYQCSALCESFDPAVVQLLVDKNPSLVNERDGTGRTALHWAVLGDNPDMLKELLAQRANPDIKDDNDYIALDYAILTGNAVIAEILLRHFGDSYAHFDKETILKLMSRFAYDLDSNGTSQRNYHFSSERLNEFLFAAAAKGSSASIVALLIENGVNPNVQANCGCTPLKIAAQNGHAEVLRALLAAHADLNATDANGFTHLHVAAEKGNVEIVRALLTARANLNAADASGFTPLHMAAQNGHVETVRELVAAHADLNIQTNKGSTSLHTAVRENSFETAVRRNSFEIVRILLAAGANSEIRACDGRPLDIAMNNRYTDPDLITLLSKATSCTIQ